MNELDQNTKGKIIESIKYIFEPMGGSLISFEASHDMYSSIRSAYGNENIFDEKNKTTYYPIIINTNFGELRISLSSDQLLNINIALGIGYAYSSFDSLNKVPREISLEIQNRIYLPKKDA